MPDYGEELIRMQDVVIAKDKRIAELEGERDQLREQLAEALKDRQHFLEQFNATAGQLALAQLALASRTLEPLTETRSA